MAQHRIVALDGWVKLPALDFEYDYREYASTTPEQLPDRIKDATIVTTAAQKVTRAGIEAAPHLQLVACNGTGTDHIDKDAIRERGVTLCNVPAQNTYSVSEHAFALYYALRRRIPQIHQSTVDGSWPQKLFTKLGPPPRINAEEILVVVGYGALGQNVEKIGRALGMRVLIAERKGATKTRSGRVAFENALKEGTLFIVVAPLEPSTRGMIAAPELDAMDSTALVINVARGGIIDEQALAQALRDGQIGGAATDVYEHEPATKENCPLLDSTIPNLVLTPHVAWYSSKTVKGTSDTVKRNLEAFVAGKPVNVVVAGRRDL
ncbi:hypothetical protein LTR85_001104 [Meristemomyces frigidus]|nr:hypothetical protein LTR85_001104 [Meristemomyces frigidus]